MTKQQIMDNYAKEQGYKNWDYLSFEVRALILNEHINKVIDLIQEELKKKTVSEITENKITWLMSWNEIRKEILNTENL